MWSADRPAAALALDPELNDRVRDVLHAMLGDRALELTEQRMFGALCFLYRGNMVCGASAQRDGRRFLMRIGKGNPLADTLPLGEPAVLGGRTMQGFRFVDADECDGDVLVRWLGACLDHAESLPPK